MDRAGNIIGPGPLANIGGLSYERVINGCGSWSCTVPLRDARTDEIENKKTMLQFTFGGNVEFVGIVEHMTQTVGSDGTLLLALSGRDQGADLAEAALGFKDATAGGVGSTDVPAQILSWATDAGVGTAPNVWSLDTSAPDGNAVTAGTCYVKFGGESALSALISVADKLGEHFRINDNANEITWMQGDWTDSGIRAIQGAPDMIGAEGNEDICFFQTLKESTDAYGLFNRIYPYMASSLEMTDGLIAASTSPPAGYVQNNAENYIESTAGIAEVGHIIPLYVQFPDIRPISNTDADLQSASNQVALAAYSMLSEHDSTEKFQTFDLGSVVQLPDAVKPGRAITVIYDDERYSVHELMYVQSIKTAIGTDGGKVHQLVVAKSIAAAPSGTEFVGSALANGKVFQTQPIMSPNSYEVSFSKPVYSDGTNNETANIYFDFDNEVQQVQRVLFVYEAENPSLMLPLESTVLATGAAGGTTEAGSAHSHSIPDHQHNLTIIGHGAGAALAYNVGFGAAGKVGGLRHDIDSSDYTYSTNANSGGTTSEDESFHTHALTNVTIQNSYGIHREGVDNTLLRADTFISINGGPILSLESPILPGDPTVELLGGNRYQLDITEYLHNTTTFRPLQATNYVTVHGQVNGTRVSCTIDGALKIRTIIQTTAVI